MVTLVDGHNLLFKRFLNKSFQVEKEVEAQSLLISSWVKSKTYLIYDGSGGRSEKGYEKNLGEQLRIIFSGIDISADDWIVSWLNRHQSKSFKVITDDLKLRKRIQRNNIQFESCLKWYQSLQKHKIIKTQGKSEFGSQAYWEDYFNG